MTNLDYWQLFVGDLSPEDFMRAHGSADPALCVSRFLNERGHLYGVVNQGVWTDTFQAPDQYHRLTVQTYLLSYLDETREEWAPALEAEPPATPLRYREVFDPDKHTPPPSSTPSSGTEEEPGKAFSATEGPAADPAAEKDHATASPAAPEPESGSPAEAPATASTEPPPAVQPEADPGTAEPGPDESSSSDTSDAPTAEDAPDPRDR